MSDTRDLSLTLDYQHGLGELAPFFEALSQGRAVAGSCPDCERCWLPPRPRCPEDGAATVPRELAGAGTIRADTSTTTQLPFTAEAAPTRFVLVAMDGATALTFGRMRDPGTEITPVTRVRLAVPDSDIAHPAQALLFECIAEEVTE